MYLYLKSFNAGGHVASPVIDVDLYKEAMLAMLGIVKLYKRNVANPFSLFMYETHLNHEVIRAWLENLLLVNSSA